MRATEDEFHRFFHPVFGLRRVLWSLLYLPGADRSGCLSCRWALASTCCQCRRTLRSRGIGLENGKKGQNSFALQQRILATLIKNVVWGPSVLRRHLTLIRPMADTLSAHPLILYLPVHPTSHLLFFPFCPFPWKNGFHETYCKVSFTVWNDWSKQQCRVTTHKHTHTR